MLPEDVDSMPDLYREDRAIGIANQHHKNDHLLNEILQKDHTLLSL